MQQMRKNIRKAVEIMEHLVRREQKKLNMAVRDLQQPCMRLSSAGCTLLNIALYSRSWHVL